MRQVVGLGIDICQINRIKAVMERRPGFIHKIFNEREELKPTFEFIASRFAAKEAIFKSLPSRIDFKDIIITTSTSGKPEVELVGLNYEIILSIAHEKDYATAVSIAFRKEI